MFPPFISSITRSSSPRVDFAELGAIAPQNEQPTTFDLELERLARSHIGEDVGRSRIDQLVEPGLADFLDEDAGARGQLLLAPLNLTFATTELLEPVQVAPGDHVGGVGFETRCIGVDRILHIAELQLGLAKPIEGGGIPRRSLDD